MKDLRKESGNKGSYEGMTTMQKVKRQIIARNNVMLFLILLFYYTGKS